MSLVFSSCGPDQCLQGGRIVDVWDQTKKRRIGRKEEKKERKTERDYQWVEISWSVSCQGVRSNVHIIVLFEWLDTSNVLRWWWRCTGCAAQRTCSTLSQCSITTISPLDQHRGTITTEITSDDELQPTRIDSRLIPSMPTTSAQWWLQETYDDTREYY